MEPLNVEHAGRTLRGIMHLPLTTPAPAVVLCHGLGGSRVGLGFVDLGRRLAELGLATYRFDFAGFGESDGDVKAFTVSDQVEQVEAVLDRLAGHRAVDAERISVLGSSMGGLTAALVSGRREVRSLVMWAPAAGRLNLPFWLHESRVEELERLGYIDFGGLPVCRPFIEDLDTFDQFAAAERHAGPVLVAGGTDDSLMRHAYIDPYRSAWGDRMELHEFEGIDHGFGTVEVRQRLLEVTEEFLVRHA